MRPQEPTVEHVQRGVGCFRVKEFVLRHDFQSGFTINLDIGETGIANALSAQNG